MFTKIWTFIKTNATAIVVVVLGLLALLFKDKAGKAEASLQTAKSDQIDAVLAQKQTDIQKQVTEQQQIEKKEENAPHTVDENVDFLKKL